MGNDEAMELAAEEEVFDCRSTSIFKSSSSAGSGPGAGRSSGCCSGHSVGTAIPSDGVRH
jgi:hypothetical protein